METLSPLNTATAATAKTGGAREKLSTDYDSFLTLLVAQVSNQDPLEPMDSTAFVSQLAQLTQVEQSITSNETLDKISSQLSTSGARSDVMLLGHDVLVPTDQLSLLDGEARFSYALDAAASKVSARILGEDGVELRRIDNLPLGAEARHEVVWDGHDSEGLPVPSGNFRVEITALDAEDEPVFHSTYASGVVERVAFRDGWPMLGLDTGAEVSPDSVISVR
ncbi:flagellar hook assembly protein FlgD [Limimaricola hongkongensis]|uniref:Basal-body rod modification protein FlgD n=1 Tax=Limimaricola hongkongensis DSM 17492 TaxID=1122180 RepID=A0A017HC59_9RHOB|nr:flagellar hook assembly protein FlgD [Limimaricola hongkongensis]EYD71961.1 Flagellar basal-body rod modification protein FlgD [Limimaricola hongkongensis DSM 17492]